MEYYFAPMEGITGYIHRNVHHSLFPGISKYFTAFIAPGQKGKFSARIYSLTTTGVSVRCPSSSPTILRISSPLR